MVDSGYPDMMQIDQFVSSSTEFVSNVPEGESNEPVNPTDPRNGELLLISPDGSAIVFNGEDSRSADTKSFIQYKFSVQRYNEFGLERCALVFTQGNHSQSDFRFGVGFYTDVYGLCALSDRQELTYPVLHADIHVENHDIHGALDNFWRSLQNFEIYPTGHAEKYYNWSKEKHMSNFVADKYFETLADMEKFIEEEQRKGKVDGVQHSVKWICSQASPLRNLTIHGNLFLSMWDCMNPKSLREIHLVDDDMRMPSSGGYMANVIVDKMIKAETQQQFVLHSVTASGIDGGAWNIVCKNCKDKNDQSKPLLYIDGRNSIPSLNDTQEVEWGLQKLRRKTLVMQNLSEEFITPPSKPVLKLKDSNTTPSNLRDAFQLLIDRNGKIETEDIVALWPSESQKMVNAQLKKTNVLLLPGYHIIEEDLVIDTDNRVLMGIGYATIQPKQFSQCKININARGVRVVSLMIQAPEQDGGVIQPGSTLITVANTTSQNTDRTVLQDIFCRVGGARTCHGFQSEAVDTMIRIEQDDVIMDHLWLWRADHCGPQQEEIDELDERPAYEKPPLPLTHLVCAGLGRDRAQCNHGLVVLGKNVSAHGLFVEHVLKECVIWHGDEGRIGFFQCELAYDVVQLWDYPALLIGKDVNSFHGRGMGIYTYFSHKWSTWGHLFSNEPQSGFGGNGKAPFVTAGIQAPQKQGIQIQTFNRFLDLRNGTGGMLSGIALYDTVGNTTLYGGATCAGSGSHSLPWSAVNLKGITGNVCYTREGPSQKKYDPLKRSDETNYHA